MRVAISRTEHFNAAHRLHNPSWTPERNESTFGKCNSPNYHGHNYEVIVTLIGEPDHETGYVFDMKLLSDLINEHVISSFDHKNLNLDVAYFKTLNPTAENIAIVIWRVLRQQIDAKFELKIKIYETERNCAEYPAV